MEYIKKNEDGYFVVWYQYFDSKESVDWIANYITRYNKMKRILKTINKI
jgi:hypothetical protein